MIHAAFQNYLDRGDRLLDGVETFAGSVKNTITPDRYKKGLGAFNAPDRAIHLEGQENFVDVPILVKHSNDDLEPGLQAITDTTPFWKFIFYCYSYHEVW